MHFLIALTMGQFTDEPRGTEVTVLPCPSHVCVCDSGDLGGVLGLLYDSSSVTPQRCPCNAMANFSKQTGNAFRIITSMALFGLLGTAVPTCRSGIGFYPTMLPEGL